MAHEEIISPGDARFGAFPGGRFRDSRPKGPVIDQEGVVVELSTGGGVTESKDSRVVERAAGGIVVGPGDDESAVAGQDEGAVLLADAGG